MNTAQEIKAKALELGFDLVGITTAAPIEGGQKAYFQDWLGRGCAAGMGYLHNHTEKRFNPAKLLDGAKSVICVALNYKPAGQQPGAVHKVANYALYEDYHPFIKSRLHALGDFIVKIAANRTVRFKACVDSAPLAERALAQRAGLGFIGKNRCLTHPTLGAQLLLGELITTLELPADEPMTITGCGGCERCIQACPTGALGGECGFDSRKCISYLTIESKGDIPEAIRPNINGLFGCDACLLACPYQAAGPVCANRDFRFFPERTVDEARATRWGKK